MNDQQRVQLRVALAQVDTRVGDLAGNAQLVTRWTVSAAEAGAHLVVFPEMTLTGYPPEDLVLRESFARASSCPSGATTIESPSKTSSSCPPTWLQ